MWCQRLDMNGKQCRRPATVTTEYHGEDGLYRNLEDDDVTWIRAHFCRKHAEAMGWTPKARARPDGRT